MTLQPSILFVCLGNICRSPLAEAAFRIEAIAAGLTVSVDSAGTGAWHVGEPPDARARATARRHGVSIEGYRARQIGVDDFFRFDEIVAMDRQNLVDLAGLAPRGATARLSLLLDHVPGREGHGIADPYYGGPEGFERTWDEVTVGARGLVARLLEG
ncbi:MAG: low molecular weight phosphotyrosine protein phosphatase [Phyllobacteriaceae bacterium]|nr:low molecular weight phosphotyrosine protein phosphatase [Phyllobacteriaceae bacterium]